MKAPAILTRNPRAIYLNDHLAGATAGVELARRAASENDGTEFGPPLRRLAQEIAQDREELVSLITEFGYPIDRVKVAVGWSAEKVGRLKPNGHVVGYTPLGRLLELEGLLAGVHAKQALWRALATTDEAQPRLAALLARADEQAKTLEDLQRKAADLAIADQ